MSSIAVVRLGQPGLSFSTNLASIPGFGALLGIEWTCTCRQGYLQLWSGDPAGVGTLVSSAFVSELSGRVDCVFSNMIGYAPGDDIYLAWSASETTLTPFDATFPDVTSLLATVTFVLTGGSDILPIVETYASMIHIPIPAVGSFALVAAGAVMYSRVYVALGTNGVYAQLWAGNPTSGGTLILTLSLIGSLSAFADLTGVDQFGRTVPLRVSDLYVATSSTRDTFSTVAAFPATITLCRVT